MKDFNNVKINLIILGPQGSGKGTQAKMLAENLGLKHIEMGSVLRRTIDSGSALGKKLEKIVNQKKELAPDEIIKKILSAELKKIPSSRGIILDGFPRTFSQIKDGEDIFQKLGRQIDKMIYIKLSPEESIKRIAKRFSCDSCGRSLILGKDIKKYEDACPFCGGASERRADDTPSGVRKRLAIFKKETLSVIKYFKKKKMLVEINGVGTVGEIHKKIIKALK